MTGRGCADCVLIFTPTRLFAFLVNAARPDRRRPAAVGLQLESRRVRRTRPRIRHFMRVLLTKTFCFEAAHDLPTFPLDHKCRRLHGHSFRFDVIVAGEVDPAKGYLIDYGDIKSAADPLLKRLDHYYLNEVEDLANPTSENIAKWIWDRLKLSLPQLAAVIVHETCTSACEYRGG